MSVTIIPKAEQAPGQFNGGAIMEKRPVVAMRGYPHLKPYSSLFYWAHAWSDNGSTIGEHPHQAFEIMSFVIKGDIEHYDSKNREWKKLKQGDVQIIRAGSGISHSEKLNANSAIFQIWLDPDLNKELQKPASYDDYTSEQFPVSEKEGEKIKLYHGEGAPMKMSTEGVKIEEVWLKPGVHSLPLGKETVNSFFLIDGKAEIDNKPVEAEDFFISKEEEALSIDVKADARLFHIQTPARSSYTTYAEMMG